MEAAFQALQSQEETRLGKRLPAFRSAPADRIQQTHRHPTARCIDHAIREHKMERVEKCRRAAHLHAWKAMPYWKMPAITPGCEQPVSEAGLTLWLCLWNFDGF